MMYVRTLPSPVKQSLLCEFFYEDDIQLKIQVYQELQTNMDTFSKDCEGLALVIQSNLDP